MLLLWSVCHFKKNYLLYDELCFSDLRYLFANRVSIFNHKDWKKTIELSQTTVSGTHITTIPTKKI